MAKCGGRNRLLALECGVGSLSRKEEEEERKKEKKKKEIEKKQGRILYF